MKKWIYPDGELYLGDCIKVMNRLPEQSVDLVLGSPAYEDRRTYGELNFSLTGQDWVDWMMEVIKASLRICKGLVAFVMEGKTEQFKWSCTPALLMADLHRAGICLRKPPIYQRASSIPGGGGPDWFRNDYEFILCCTNERRRLPWSDNKACGHKPKWGVGGPLSHRLKNGDRKPKRVPANYVNGDVQFKESYDGVKVKIANPGNIIKEPTSMLIYANTGGGKMGSNIGNENEAPFPEKVADTMIKSFCPPGGITLDPFMGSGTVASRAIQNGRRFIGVDIRMSQIKLMQRRIKQARLRKGFGIT